VGPRLPNPSTWGAPKEVISTAFMLFYKQNWHLARVLIA
jgi:hypothetical protein